MSIGFGVKMFCFVVIVYEVDPIAGNVCVSSVVRFRSRVLSPTQSVERRYKLWTTRHRTIEETFCWQLWGFVPFMSTEIFVGVTHLILIPRFVPCHETPFLVSF
jgi:hypothetical protein